MKKAVVLLSGGLDSATVLAIAKSENFECYALSFDYGQRHFCELEAAEKVAKQLGAAKHNTVKIDLRLWGGSPRPPMRWRCRRHRRRPASRSPTFRPGT